MGKTQNKNVPKITVIQRVGKKQKTQRNRVKRIVNRGRKAVRGFSQAGEAFLKCAYAAPDFSMGKMLGIPDGELVSTKTFVQDHGFLGPMTFTSGQTRWYIVLPTPGVAFWYTDTTGTAFPLRTATWTPQYFPGCFGSGALFSDVANQRNDNFNKFRYVSNIVEITNTSNAMSWSGNITVWKTPVATVVNQITKTQTYNTLAPTTPFAIVGTTTVSLNVPDTNMSGLDGIQAVPINARPFKFKDGCYAMATNKGPIFPITPILEGINRLPTQDAGGSTTSNMDGILDGPYLGCGNMDAIVIRVVQPATTATIPVNSALIQVWACVEYVVTADSQYYASARTGAPRDQKALDAYQKVATQLATACNQADNKGFWEWVLTIIKGTASTLAYMPGATGMVGAGVGMAISGLEALYM